MMVSTPLSMRTISMKSGYLNLKVKTKYNNNPRINPIFKNAATDGYVTRHVGNDPEQTNQILDTLGVDSMSELIG